MNGFKHQIRAWGAFLTVMLMVGGVLTSAVLHAPESDSAIPESAAKTRLLSHLNLVDAIGYDADAILLFSGREPVMVVWISSSPAELWRVDGSFVGALSNGELHRVVEITSEMVGRCDPPEWLRINSVGRQMA